MGLTRSVFVGVLWCFVVLVNITNGKTALETSHGRTVQDETSEPRGRHRIQMLFPLLLRISARLASLVPTALMGLAGIFLFVTLSKKAFLISLFALYVALSQKYKKKKSQIHIHKVNSYPEYYDEDEYVHYHHWPPKKWKPYRSRRPYWKKKTYLKRTFRPLRHEPYLAQSDAYSFPEYKIHLQDTLPFVDYPIVDFKPLAEPNITKRIDFSLETLGERVKTGPVLFPSMTEDRQGRRLYDDDVLSTRN